MHVYWMKKNNKRRESVARIIILHRWIFFFEEQAKASMDYFDSKIKCLLQDTVNYFCTGGMLDRRRLLLIPAISISIGSFDKGAAKAEFADSESFITLDTPLSDLFTF